MLGVNKNVTYELDGGFLFSAPLSWNLEDLPTDTPGNYTVTGFPALPEGLLLPEEFSSVSCEVCLQDDTKLTLSPPVINQYTLFMEWYKKTPEKNLFQFYYAVGDGEWQEDISGGFMRLKSDSQTLEVDFSGNESLLLGTSYFFRLQYDGEWSNTIEIFLEEGSLRYRWCDGDRDGGDRNEQESPDIIQNVPDTPPEETVPSDNAPLETVPSDDAPPVTETFPSSEGESSSLPRTHSFTGGGRKGPGTKQSKDTEGYGPGYPEEALSVTENQAAQVAGDESAVKEEFEKDTGNTAVWSGTRIKAYKNLNTGWPLLFEKQQICLELPVDDPLFYDLTSNDLLHVEIEALTDRTVRIELNWNKNYITGLPITVTMPWDISNGCKDLRVTDSEGNFVGEAIYNAADSRISFQAEGSGTFTIESSAVPSLSQTPDPPSVNDNISSGKNSPIPTEKTSYASEAKDTTAPYIIAITVLAAALVLAGGILCFRNHPKGGGDNT
ncbi:hypothetical protein DXA13_18035 [Clostridium sp. AM58-1XD]|nr:hypothetical protein DXA13_18035 [Clostridium sp. AM58-1XD]